MKVVKKLLGLFKPTEKKQIDYIDVFDSAIKDAMSVFDVTKVKLQNINERIADRIDKNDERIDELQTLKVTLEAENNVFADQANSNNKKISKIVQFLKA